ncbi:MAG: putative nucleotidyltransferase [Candidatus Alkanophagales archaeon MCA70_species_2]|nr:putative nucleotidyltransferase [Candidatus Alkanophaga liquidiphilum]
MPSFVVEESLNSAKVFWLEQEKLVEEVFKVAKRIGEENENVLKIVLFGSLAEGRGVPGSDADILIILKEDDRSFIDRIAEWSERFALDFPIEVFPYTEKELNTPIAQEAVKKGITLFKRA